MTLKIKFPFDLVSFLEWLKSTYPSLDFLYTLKDTEITVALKSATMTQGQKDAILAHWNGLDQSAEAVKLAKNSRKTGQAKIDFEIQVKTFLAGKEWDSMTSAEKKFVMSVPLSNSEYDTLTTS